MRKTYITNMPDQAGAFLTASKAIAECGGNIVRVNYNRAVDTRTLLIEVDATEEQQELISDRLKDIEYLVDDPGMRQIILIELVLPDVPGALLPTLEVIKRHEVNIPYINSQENGTPYQNFKMGLLVENTAEIKGLLDDLSKICEVRVLDYEATDRLLDSTIFYVTFANTLRETLGLSQEETNGALAQANKVMQVVDKRDESPKEVFGRIQRFAELIVENSGRDFKATVTRHRLADRLTMHVIEPPFGGNTYILEYYGALLFVDCGLGCFENEMRTLLDDLFGDFSFRRKSALITHPDIDAAGLLRLFDTVYLNRTCYSNFVNEHKGRASYRERNPMHAPYNTLTKILSRYETPQLGRCVVIGGRSGDDPLETIGSMRFGDWNLRIIEGAGGHARGETIITCPELRVAFTGDLLVNDTGLTDLQRTFLDLQPHLRASYDTKPELAGRIRGQLRHELDGYTICPGRGPLIR
ncbi:MAG: hypothetical protein QM302_00370 [Acidobacteriota bacterium]|nr:hypothetical protein [Acidobacteriota bacterium]